METGHQDRLGQTPPSYPVIGSIQGPGPGLLVGEGGVSDRSGTATPAGSAPPLRRKPTPMSTTYALAGEVCWKCGADATVVISDLLWPYCEPHAIDRMADEITHALLVGTLDAAREDLARLAAKGFA